MIVVRNVHIYLSIGAFILGIFLALMLLRQRTEPLTLEGLTIARARWSAAGIPSYDLRYTMHGAEYFVGVRNNVVQSVLVNGAPSTSAEPSQYSVEGLLLTLEQELAALGNGSMDGSTQAKAPIMRVHFHEKYGYPVRYIRSAAASVRSASIEVQEFTISR